jgi:GNAT superfamily N-acetyltransferase
MADFTIRPGTSDDVRPAYDVFRTSLWDYLEQIGVISPGTPNDIEASWAKHKSVVGHIYRHAAEFWVAEDAAGILGLARSLERDGVLQLTEFFVHPRNQAGGVGRALLERAFPLGRGRHRSIMATQNPRALGLYLKFGVTFQSTLTDFQIRPVSHEYSTDLEFINLSDLDDPVTAVGAIDRRFLDHERPEDIEFFMSDRPGFAYRRNGDVVGYGFESNGDSAGPILASDPADIPAALSHLENSAAEAEIEEIDVGIALDSTTAVRWMLDRRHQMVPFHIALLGSDPFIPRDRYIPFNPSLFF